LRQKNIGTDTEALNQQRSHWKKTFLKNPEMFGEKPSEPAKKATELFRKEGKKKILELGDLARPEKTLKRKRDVS
jgi:hypothetical protein